MHKRFTRAGVPVFLRSKSPWQGTNENTNGLVRQYFPKGLELSAFTQHELDTIAVRLNRRRHARSHQDFLPTKSHHWRCCDDGLNPSRLF